jgi:histidinol-phosphatase (PHP family)
MLPDYHIHTSFCKHAEGRMEEFLEAARQKKLPEICFTDHVPNPDNYDPGNRMSMNEFESYKEKIASLSVASGAPLVMFGVEADYYNGCERFLRKWLPRHKFDLVIGSIHYIKNWGFDNPDERAVWDNVDVADTWRKYFELIGRLADTHLFDVIGHFDLPKKFGYAPDARAIKEMAGPALEKIAHAQMAIEINTSGLRKPVKEIYPSVMLLGMARENGIPICFGSDAHKPDEVGYEFAVGIEWARKAGYSEAARFSARHKKNYALPEI